MAVETWLILTVWVGYALGGLALQERQHHRARNRQERDFGPPEYQASVVVGLRGVHDRLPEVLEALCNQRYPLDYEVVMACESKSDPAWAVAVEVARSHNHVQLVEAEEVDPGLRSGKNQNLLAATEAARYEVLAYTDADVVHPPDWLARLVAPLGKVVEGREVVAATRLFFLRPTTFWGRLAAIGVNQVTYAAANLQRKGPWAPFASGASTAVLAGTLRTCKVTRAWKEAFNDDLVLANLILDNGYPLYLLREPTWPAEALTNWREFGAKFRRWVVTLHYYSHPKLARQAYAQATAQQQLPVALVLALWLVLAGAPWPVVAALVAGGLVYSLTTRAAIAQAIGEPLGPWLLLAPLAYLFFIGLYLVMLWPRSFTWAGRTHHISESYSELADRLELLSAQTEANTSLTARQ